MSLEQMMWVEKYRPSKLADLVDQEAVKGRLKLLVENKGEMPHLLFAGPPGSGKTTMSMILARELLGERYAEYVLSLNASDERGIDIVRERVKTFARFVDRREGIPFRLVILDESDEMTKDAQTALRRIMEESSGYTRFILICNYSSGIIEPLQSRCAIFRFQRYDRESVTAHLATIAKKEKVKVPGKEAFEAIYDATQGDLRQAINLLQAASASGTLDLDSVKAATGSNVKSKATQIIELALEGDFDGARAKMVELTRVYGIPERDFLRFANEAVSSMKLDDVAAVLTILAEYDYRIIQGAQPELQLTAMLAQLSSLKRKSG